MIKKDNVVVMDLIHQACWKNCEYSLSERGTAQFVHDRIREAFLAKISNQERSNHLEIGQLLQELYKRQEEKVLFQLTYHLMEGSDDKRD